MVGVVRVDGSGLAKWQTREGRSPRFEGKGEDEFGGWDGTLYQ